MTEFDFKQLQSLKTPEKWVEKAINIPKQKNKPTPFLLSPSVIGSAAAIVIVLAVIFTLRLQANTPQLPPVSSGAAAVQPVPTVTEATVPPETSAATNAGSETAVTAASDSEAALQPMPTVTDIVFPETPIKSTVPPSSKAEVPSEATNPSTQPLTSPPVQPSTQPTVQPATQPFTEPPTQPETELITDPSAEDDVTTPASATEPNTADNSFYGTIQFRILDSSLFFSSNSIRIAVFTADGTSVGVPKSLRPAITEEGVKTATLNPHLQNIMLTCGEVYTLQVTGSKGVSESFALVPKAVNPLIFYL